MPTEPIVDTQRGWRQWYIDEIYSGPGNPGQFVPNVNDAVLEWTAGGYAMHRVSGINVDLTSVLEDRSAEAGDGGVLQEDVLLGSGPGTLSEQYRVYINTQVTPHTLDFSPFLLIRGSRAAKVKVFAGTDISNTGQVISAIYASGVVTSNVIPLEVVENAVGNYVAVKRPQHAWSTVPLETNDVVTAVVYDVDDVVIWWGKLIVCNSNFVQGAAVLSKYIVDVELLSPYLSVSDNHLLELPANMSIQSLSLQGKITYSDATTQILPIDGGRFNLLGLSQYTGSQPGQHVDLTLVYTLDDNEQAMNPNVVEGRRFIPRRYGITTIESLGAYSVKLFAVPYWKTTPTPQWALAYYLYDLNRQALFDVTSLVSYSNALASFNGTAIGVTQTLTAALNLQDVHPSYTIYRYVQTFNITLLSSGTNGTVNNYFTLEYTPGHQHGAGLVAPGAIDPLDPLKWKLDLSLNLSDVNDWLNRVYWPTEPLKSLFEASAPTPTHVRVRLGSSFVREIMVEEFSYPFGQIPVQPLQGDAVRLEFFKRIGSTDIELGMSSLIVKR